MKHFMKWNGIAMLSIDPSIRKSGYAIWNDGRLTDKGLISLDGSDDVFRIQTLAQEFRELSGRIQQQNNRFFTIIETPDGYSYRRSSRGAKALNMGSLMKLCKAIGAIEAAVSVHCEWLYEIPVTSWKGKTPKKITRAYVDSVYHVTQSDIVDAIGLGDWIIRYTNKPDGL